MRAPTVEVELWEVPAPLPEPVLTPAGTFTTYFHLAVVARGADAEGWGLAAVVTEAQLAEVTDHARRLLGDGPATIADLLGAEALDETSGPTTTSRAAAGALATAGWDLAARHLGVACADLWGRVAGRQDLDAYRSGLFLSTPLDALVAEARRHRGDGYRRVKMRTGLDVERDLERLAAVASVFDEPGTVAVDAVNAWTVEAAAEFVARSPVPLLWVEDPVPLDELAALTARTDDVLVAAGESEETVADLVALRDRGGVGAALLDVQRLGGPRRFLAAAAVLADHGARIGAHIFTPVSAQLLACVADPLPLEVFDWSDALYARVPVPDPLGRVSLTGPGLGVDLDHEVLGALGRRVL